MGLIEIQMHKIGHGFKHCIRQISARNIRPAELAAQKSCLLQASLRQAHTCQV
jgi:hypothetical protein